MYNKFIRIVLFFEETKVYQIYFLIFSKICLTEENLSSQSSLRKN